MPCSILSLDIEDVMGTHHLNSQDSIIKYRIDRTAQDIDVYTNPVELKTELEEDLLEENYHDHSEKKNKVTTGNKNNSLADTKNNTSNNATKIAPVIPEINQKFYEDVKLSLEKNEGCRIAGDISVKKVPGNFHVSTHNFKPIISKLVSEDHYTFDLTHKII